MVFFQKIRKESHPCNPKIHQSDPPKKVTETIHLEGVEYGEWDYVENSEKYG
jgi:hypothetical protein